MPSFGEVNPAFFTIVTFPFLFGVMFGDIGHGIVLFAFGSILCLANNYISHIKELELFLYMRYFILLMGFFATYCGLLYNDFMSIPLEIFGKGCYKYDQESNKNIRIDNDCVYPFGIDPVWSNSENDIIFYNSFKMKAAVIMGVAQMSLGICMKGLNAWNFNKKLDFLHEFLP